MRLIRISTNYPAYLQQFYAQRPELPSMTYTEQYRVLMNDCYGWADFWTRPLGKLGYEVWEPVVNAEPMQKAWAKEHDVRYRKKHWLFDITTEQIKHFRPDVVFVNHYSTFTKEFFEDLRQECPSIRLLIGWCGAPYHEASIFRVYDLILSNIPGLVEHFRQNGHQCTYFRHAFEAEILKRIHRPHPKTSEFSFIGSLAKLSQFHNEREKLLTQLLAVTKLQLWLNTPSPSLRLRRIIRFHQRLYDLTHRVTSTLHWTKNFFSRIPLIKSYTTMARRPELPAPIDATLTELAHPALFGLAMYQQLHDSKLTLNTHIDIAREYASNMRLYEATGVGTCLLTEAQPDLHEIFEPDTEIVTYASAEEAAEKANYLLTHERERTEIAAAGQRRTLRDHNFVLRSQQLDALIRKRLASH